MSRRTKLLITALFLVLLAIPAASVAITWQPAFPLRFHLENIDAELVKDDPRYRSLRVRVENSSSIPIYFHGGFMDTNFGPPVFGGSQGLLLPCPYSDSNSSWSDEPLIIPAHGALHIRGALGSKLTKIPRGGEITIQCRWETGTHAGVARAMDWIRYRCPQWGTGRLPRIEQLRTTAPLEMGKQVQAPLPAPVPSAP